jgi:hypothetical protein
MVQIGKRDDFGDIFTVYLNLLTPRTAPESFCEYLRNLRLKFLHLGLTGTLDSTPQNKPQNTLMRRCFFLSFFVIITHFETTKN